MVDTVIGKREANKQGTRAALKAAANRLFEEHGYAATTVREIAAAAGVTERTFFRYFDGKEDLVVDEVLAWVPRLQQAIRDRPAEEPPLVAVRAALGQLGAAARATSQPSPLRLFADSLPAQRAGRSGRRLSPAMLLGIEDDLAAALGDRLPADTSDETSDVRGTTDRDFRAALLARVTLAVLRTAIIHDRALRQADTTERPAVSELIDQAFAALGVTTAAG